MSGPDKLAGLSPEQKRAMLAQLMQAKAAPAPATPAATAAGMALSLLYFSNVDDPADRDKYRLCLEGARFADRHGFEAVWLPERHFHPFGGLYPRPAVLAGALAMITERVRLRSGSVVLPLNNPIQVAEEWAVVDNLSGGRVDLGLAAGWNPADFVLAPDCYADRVSTLERHLDVIRRLWAGEAITRPDGQGNPAAVAIHPRPLQRELPIWITAAGGHERFVHAGALGANVLTALLIQTTDDLAERIRLYREARERHGHDPAAGRVTLMLHTFVGDDMAEVRRLVRAPFLAYLESSVSLWKQHSARLEGVPPEDRERVFEYAFERYFQTGALFGTPDACLGKLADLRAIGVDEVACLIDFGVGAEDVLGSLRHLARLRELANP